MAGIDLNQLRTQLGFESWNEMQQAAHRLIPGREDIMLLAPTGTGKTLAYLPPLTELLEPKQAGVQILVLTPSRELALQTEEVWRKMNTGRKVSSFYGGRDLATDKGKLQEPPALLIGTPGRITDHISRETFGTGTVHTIVLDEFDKLLALGFEEELSYIIRSLPGLRQRILVSATRPEEMPAFTGVSAPGILDFRDASEQSITTPDRLKMHLVNAPEKDKIPTLVRLLCHTGSQSALIFCNHREAVDRTAGLLHKEGIVSAAFHGGMDQETRELTLARFRNGSVHFLVTTDLAGRGLDIPEVQHVIHYHLPHTHEDFVHRNGRTARMFAKGTIWLMLHESETLPNYVSPQPEIISLPAAGQLPPPPSWVTVRINGGRKQKISKGDIAGFFMKTGGLAKNELGMIEIKDQCAYAAVKKDKSRTLLEKTLNEKMKGRAYKLTVIR